MTAADPTPWPWWPLIIVIVLLAAVAWVAKVIDAERYRQQCIHSAELGRCEGPGCRQPVVPRAFLTLRESQGSVRTLCPACIRGQA